MLKISNNINQFKGLLSKSGEGFTLIEMLAVIAIIGIFSSMGIVKFRENGRRTELNTNTIVFLNALEEVRNKALTGATIDGEVSLSYGLLVAESFDFDQLPGQNCSFGCLYASTTSRLVYLSETDILGDIVVLVDGINETRVDFRLPRAKPLILLDQTESPDVLFQLDYLSNSRCVEVNSISGRMEMLSCPS